MPQAKVWNVDGPEVLTRFMKTSNFDQAKNPPPPGSSPRLQAPHSTPFGLSAALQTFADGEV